MKKILVLISIVLICISCFIADFYTQADFDGFTGALAQENNGVIYVAKQEKGKNTIIQTDKEGNLIMQYSFKQKKGGEISTVKSLFVDERNSLFILKEWVDAKTGNIVRNDILKLDGKFTPSATFHVVFSESGGKLNSICDFSVENETLYTTYIVGEGKQVETKGMVIPKDGSDINSETHLICDIQKTAPADDIYSQAVVVQGQIYTLLKSGNVVVYSIKGQQEIAHTSFAKAHCLMKGKNSAIAISADKESVITNGSQYPSVNDLSYVLEAGGIFKVIGGIQNENANIYVGQNENGSIQLNCLYANDFFTITKVECAWSKVLQNIWLQVMCIILVTSAIVAIYCVARRKELFVKKQSLPTAKLTLAIMLVVTILGSGFVIVLGNTYKNEMITQQGVLGETIHKQILNTMSGLDITNIHSETFIKSQDGRSLQATLNEANSLQSKNKTSNKVFTYVGGEFFNLMGDEQVILTSAKINYNKDYIELLSKGIEAQSLNQYIYTDENFEYLLTISPVKGKFNTVAGVLVTEMSLGRIDQNLFGFLLRTMIILIGFIALLGGATTYISRKILEPISKMPKILLDTAQGRMDESDVKIFEKSYVGIYRALNEMGRVWKQRVHEQNNLTESYYRFVPRKIQQLLLKKSVADVNFGDSNISEDIIVTVTVKNRESAKHKLADNRFMLFVNNCFNLINTNLEKYNGIFISREFDLAELRMLFKSYGDAVDFAVTLQDEAINYQMETGDTPELFSTIHEARHFYGIAGSEKQVLPFMVSPETDFIGGLRKNIRLTGSKILITESIHKNVNSNYSLRYIGYVSDSVTGKVFKLYEVLNAYSAKERMIYEKFSRRIEEGINLFYKNDFYLARSVFSSILYECPTDNLARWYLFACDKYFHADEADISHDLLEMGGGNEQ